MNMKKCIRYCLLMMLLGGALLFSGCGREKLPENGTPEPASLNGTFVSEQGSMTFNGDGKSIRYDFSEEFAATAGLAEASGEGEYVFLFQHGTYRYDLAETFEIIEGENRISFVNRHHVTNENAICLQSPTDGAEDITFEKKADAK